MNNNKLYSFKILIFILINFKNDLLYARENFEDYSEISLTNNNVIHNGTYVFGKEIFFDFEGEKIRKGSYDKRYILEKLKECTNEKYFCFKSISYSLVLPKYCEDIESGVGAKFYVGDITTRVISLKKENIRDTALHPEGVIYRYILANDSNPYVVYEYIQGSFHKTLSVIYEDLSKKNNLIVLFSKPDTIKYSKLKRLRKNRVFIEHRFSDTNDFAPCMITAPPTKLSYPYP